MSTGNSLRKAIGREVAATGRMKPKPTPRDNRGRMVPTKCPVKNCDGHLIQERDEWRCNGLIDPDNPSAELRACGYRHRDGDEYQSN